MIPPYPRRAITPIVKILRISMMRPIMKDVSTFSLMFERARLQPSHCGSHVDG
jgi:hypothetical protein